VHGVARLIEEVGSGIVAARRTARCGRWLWFGVGGLARRRRWSSPTRLSRSLQLRQDLVRWYVAELWGLQVGAQWLRRGLDASVTDHVISIGSPLLHLAHPRPQRADVESIDKPSTRAAPYAGSQQGVQVFAAGSSIAKHGVSSLSCALCAQGRSQRCRKALLVRHLHHQDWQANHPG